MKRLIPIIVVLLIIVGVIVAGPGMDMIEGLRYGDEEADLMEHFHLEDEDHAAIIMNNTVIETQAIVRDGEYYLPLDFVKDTFNKHFYLDEREGLLLYSTPDTVYAVNIGDGYNYIYGTNTVVNDKGKPIIFIEGEIPYILMSYVRDYTNFRADIYENPHRVELDNTYEECNVATIKKDTNIRYQGGVKSPILTSIEKEDEVIIIEEMETWVKVKAKGFLGYVEKKRLTEARSVKPEPVTTYDEPEYSHILLDGKVCLGWHQVGSAESAVSTFDSVTASTQGMNVISPTWFSLSDNEGNFRSIASSAYVAKAHAKGMQVWGLIDNFSTNISSFEILSRTSVRTRLVNGLIREAAACGMDGINVDFEQLGGETGEHFAQFIRELSIACRREGLILSVDNYAPQGGTDFYRRDVQGEVADYIIIMGYDEHWAGSGTPGSVASISYVETGIAMTLREAEASRVINGVPFYTRVWMTNSKGVSDQALGMADAQDFLRRHNATASWDDATGQNVAEFQEGNTFYQVWMEDNQSLEVKLNMMNSYGLGGVAIWKLGFEEPSVWNVIDGYLHG